MPNSDVFDELMDHWEEQFDQGKELLPEELCREHPEFVEAARKYIRAMKAVGATMTETVSASAPTLPPKSSPRPEIPGYAILDELGRGGMGVVYRAMQLSLKRLVALKMILREDLAGANGIARFRGEAEALGQLQHPNIVQVYDVGESSGHPYFALELVSGGSLNQRLGGVPQPPRDAAQLVTTLARAVHFAHERGFIHRDLKPGNILLGSTGEPKITDFGLAKRWSSDAAATVDDFVRTASGEVLGTPGYMAPEQARGDVRSIGPGADIYSLGAILYELLTGRIPFTGQSLLEVLEQVVHSAPTPPRTVQQTIPRDLDTICLKCLEKSPSRRYLTAGLLADDLQRFLDGQPILARPITLPVRFGRWCSRNPFLAGTSIAAFLAMLATAIISVAFAIESEHSRKALQESRDKLGEALAASETHRKEALRQLTESSLDRGLALCDQGEIAQGMWWLVRALDYADEFPELKLVIEANLTAWSGQLCVLERVLEHSRQVAAAAISADNRLLATASAGESNVRFWSLATGESVPMAFPENTPEVASLAFHPSDPILATAGNDRQLRIWRVRDGVQLLASLPTEGIAKKLRFSPDGRWLGAETGNRLMVRDAADDFMPAKPIDKTLDSADFAFIPGTSALVMADFAKNQIHFWDYEAGKQSTASFRTIEKPLYLAVSPDTRHLAVGGVGILPTLYATGAMLPKPRLPGIPVHVHRLAFDPSSTFLLMGKQSGSASLWNVVDDRPHGSPMVHGGGVNIALFTSDGLRVVTSAGDRTTRIWRMPANSAVKSFLHSELEKSIAAAISPDGKQILSLTQEAGVTEDTELASLWDVQTGERLGTPLRVPATRAQFDHSGRWVLLSGKQNRVFLVDLSTRQLSAVEPVPKGPTILDAVFSPDGKQLILGAADGTIHIWDRAEGKLVGSPMRHEQPAARLLLNRDGTRLFTSGGPNLTAGKGRTTLWNPATGERLVVLDSEQIAEAAAFSPDGRWLTTSGKDGTIHLWGANSGAAFGTLEGHAGDVKDLAFHPESQLLASASKDGTVRLWRMERKELVGSLRHPGEVEKVSFSPDGRTILTHSFVAGAARLWDVATLRQLGPPRMYYRTRAGYFQSTLLFAPDGKSFLTAGEASVQLFPVPLSRDRGKEFWANWMRAKTGQELDVGGAFRVLGAAEQRRAAATVSDDK